MLKKSIILALAGTFIVAVSACGGGGGGGGGSGDSSSNNCVPSGNSVAYVGSAIAVSNIAASRGTGMSKTLLNGTCYTGEDLLLSSGTKETWSGTITKSSDGRFTSVEGSDTSYGMFTSGEGVGVSAELTTPLQIDIDIKQSSGLTNATFSGKYHLVSIDMTGWVGYATLTSKGDGTGTFQDVKNSSNTLVNGTFTYTVSDTGQMDITTSEGYTVHGQISADGNLLSAVDVDGGLAKNVNDLGLVVAAKMSTGKSTTSADGNWTSLGVGLNPSGIWDGWYEDTVISNGSVTWNELYTSPGTPGSGTYTLTVDPTGYVSAPDGTGYGFITPSGDILVTLGSDADGNGINISVRKIVP